MGEAGRPLNHLGNPLKPKSTAKSPTRAPGPQKKKLVTAGGGSGPTRGRTLETLHRLLERMFIGNYEALPGTANLAVKAPQTTISQFGGGGTLEPPWEVLPLAPLGRLGFPPLGRKPLRKTTANRDISQFCPRFAAWGLPRRFDPFPPPPAPGRRASRGKPQAVKLQQNLEISGVSRPQPPGGSSSRVPPPQAGSAPRPRTASLPGEAGRLPAVKLPKTLEISRISQNFAGICPPEPPWRVLLLNPPPGRLCPPPQDGEPPPGGETPATILKYPGYSGISPNSYLKILQEFHRLNLPGGSSSRVPPPGWLRPPPQDGEPPWGGSRR